MPLPSPVHNLSEFLAIKFADGSLQYTSVLNTLISLLPGQITQAQLPSVIDIGTF